MLDLRWPGDDRAGDLAASVGMIVWEPPGLGTDGQLRPRVRTRPGLELPARPRLEVAYWSMRYRMNDE